MLTSRFTRRWPANNLVRELGSVTNGIDSFCAPSARVGFTVVVAVHEQVVEPLGKPDVENVFQMFPL